MSAIRKLTGTFAESGIDDEIILMRLDNGELLSFDGTAAATWRSIDGTLDRDALIAKLAREHDASEGRIRSDVAQLLSELAEAGLIAES